MKTSLVLSAVASALLLGSAAYAQNIPAASVPGTNRMNIPNEAATPKVPYTPSRVTADDPPLTLRNGAVSTGLYGYYDYQSNGMSPGWLRVEKGNPQRIHATYMLSLDKGDDDTLIVSSSRRVGYALSTDGGKTWASTRELEPGLRLGFPYLQVGADGTPGIVVHGDPDGTGAIHSIFFLGTGGTNFTRLGEFPLQTASGRIGDQGAGVIWPAYVIDPKDPAKGVFIGSYSRPAGQAFAAPLQYQVAGLGDSGPWKNLEDSVHTNTSGGNYVITTSASGKIGIATYTSASSNGTDADHTIQGIYYLESTDGGNSWSTPVNVYSAVPGELSDNRYPSGNLDMVYLGEEPHIVMSSIDSGFFAGHEIYQWSPSNGLSRIVKTDLNLGIGVSTAALNKVQPNMDNLAYPTISAGDDGKHLVVTFQATSQALDSNGDPSTSVTSPDGFSYYRLWSIGSPDGGKGWGTPFIIQDFAGDESDSASIEYPSADEVLRKVNGQYELNVAFQARRFPGMYAFVQNIVDQQGNPAQADRGPFSECFQYFQRTLINEDQFNVSGGNSSVPSTSPAASLKLGSFYPNPASSNATVQYTLPTVGDVTIKVYNSLGAEVMQPVDGEHGFAGTYTKALDVSNLPAGQYRVVMSFNGQIASGSLNVVR